MTRGKTTATARGLVLVSAVLMLFGVPAARAQRGAGPIVDWRTIVGSGSTRQLEVAARTVEMKRSAGAVPGYPGPWRGARPGIPEAFAPVRPQQLPVPNTGRSTKRKVFGAVVGGVGGFFGGGLLGAIIASKTCNPCDDPEIAGFVIGAPIGGTAGGILGYRFLF